MAILANRTKIRNSKIEFSKLAILHPRRILTIIIVVATSYLLYFSPPRISNGSLEFTGHVIASSTVIYDFIFKQINSLAQKLAYLKNLATENVELKLELAEIKKQYRELQHIKAENLLLRKSLMVVETLPNKYITARIFSIHWGPWGKAALIGAGTKHGLQVNQVVTNDEGLIGRIVEVSPNYAKVMLVNDCNSRIPIITQISRERGILAGNGDIVNIIYLDDNHSAQPGEIVITSGDGKIYPYGIEVAKIIEVNQKKVVVHPLVNLTKVELVNVYAVIDQELDY